LLKPEKSTRLSVLSSDLDDAKDEVVELCGIERGGHPS
jgi:hypothetical protein